MQSDLNNAIVDAKREIKEAALYAQRAQDARSNRERRDDIEAAIKSATYAIEKLQSARLLVNGVAVVDREGVRG